MKNDSTARKREPHKANLLQAFITFGLLILAMGVGIIIFEVDPHMPMFIGVIIAAVMALFLGFDWADIEQAMVHGITQALQSIIILAIIGILVGVWILAGVVPSMIYYGLMILKPSIFLVATVLICSITSLATGSSWGTAGTMGIALMGVAHGMGIPAPLAAGAILSGAYFGDKMSPLSDTTNLAPAMAGTDVITHVKAMAKPTVLAYILTLGIFAYWSSKFAGGAADTSGIAVLQQGLADNFTISPILLLPPVIVIVSIALKVPAIPGIVLGIISATIMAPIFQGADFGQILVAGMDGYTAEFGIEALDRLLTAGGLSGMMFSISLTIIAMMFGGIAELTGTLEVIVNLILKLAKGATGLVTATIATCIVSNLTMPEQYISIVIPGRMYAKTYRDRGYHPKMLSSTLEAGGTVSGVFIPWHTCGVYMSGVLGVGVLQFAPYVYFNILMPICAIVLTIIGQNTFWAKDDLDTIVAD